MGDRRTFRNGYASPGMIAAYNAGLSLRTVGALWGMSRGFAFKRLHKSDVNMRPVGGRVKQPPPDVVARYRDIAEREMHRETMPKGGRQTRYATVGMIAAYSAGLTMRCVGELWGGLSPGLVQNRLWASDVTTRTCKEARVQKSAPPGVVAYFRSVASAELKRAEVTGRDPFGPPCVDCEKTPLVCTCKDASGAAIDRHPDD